MIGFLIFISPAILIGVILWKLADKWLTNREGAQSSRHPPGPRGLPDRGASAPTA
jgi:hypothetical protein